MKIIDTHQHLWDLKRFDYSWTARNPLFHRSYLISDYKDATQGLDIVKSVHVEADIDEPHILGETRWVLELAERDDNPIAGVIAAARPEYDNFREMIEQIAGHPRLKGVRRILHTGQPDELSTTTTFTENIRSLEEFDLSFDLCFLGRQLPFAARLIKECPNVRFILDHCGNPDIINQDYTAWRASIEEIASLPNVACKVSGIVVNTDLENWTAEDLRPAIEHVISSFGWDRVMFGSDWPVCLLTASYRQWVEALTYLTQDAGEENQRKLFVENAERIYRL